MAIKISEVKITDIKEYMKVESSDEDNIINAIMQAAKAHIKAYTGLTLATMEDKEDLTIVLFILCTEMYENRSGTSKDGSKIREVLDRLLGAHSINLL